MPRPNDAPMMPLPDGNGVTVDMIKIARLVNKGVLLLSGPNDMIALIQCDREQAVAYRDEIIAAVRVWSFGRPLPRMSWEVSNQGTAAIPSAAPTQPASDPEQASLRVLPGATG